MSNSQVADSLRRLASSIEKLPREYRPGDATVLTGEASLGGAITLAYLRSLFTVSPKDIFTRDEILVILSSVAADENLFDGNALAILDLIDEGEFDG